MGTADLCSTVVGTTVSSTEAKGRREEEEELKFMILRDAVDDTVGNMISALLDKSLEPFVAV